MAWIYLIYFVVGSIFAYGYHYDHKDELEKLESQYDYYDRKQAHSMVCLTMTAICLAWPLYIIYKLAKKYISNEKSN